MLSAETSKRDRRGDAVKLRGLARLKSRDARWYLPDDAELGETLTDEERARRVNQAARVLWKLARPRRDNYARYWGLYSNVPLPGLTPRKFNQRIMSQVRRKLSLNVVASVCDAYVAKITNQQPKVSFQTSGGKWELRQRAKLLEKFNDGMLYENDAYELGAQLELDAALFGTATVMVVPEGEKADTQVKYRRAFPFSFFCDDVEAHAGDPRTFYYREWIDRLQAMALYPEYAEQIADVETEREDDEDGQGDEVEAPTDTVCLTWAWHLPSGAGPWGRGGTDTGDGMYCLTIGDIMVEKGECRRFPFEFLYVARPVNGVWGRGFAEQLQGIQFELDALLNVIRVAMKVGGSLRWLIPYGANVNENFISDIIGSGLLYDGPVPPTPITPPTVSPDIFQQIDRLYQRAYEIPGISQLSATSMAPSHEESGAAKRLRLDTESERFQVAFGLYKHLFLRLARQTIALCRELAAEETGFSVKCITRRTMTVVKWADAHLDDADFTMKMFATSAFSTTPEARLDQVQEVLNSGSGLINWQEGRRLLNDPDLEEFDSVADASFNLAQDMISDILERGEYLPPVDQMNLEEAKKLGQLAWLQAYRYKAPQDRLDMLDDWVQQCIALLPPPPPPPMPPAMPGAPPPMPMPPPGPPMAPPGAGLPMAA